MKLKIIVVSAILLGLAQQSCKNNSVESKIVPNASPKFGLSVGNLWSYDVIIYDSIGTGKKLMNYYRTVSRDTIIDEDKYSILKIDTSLSFSGVGTPVIENSEGYYTRMKYQKGANSDRRDTVILMYKYASNLNYQYQINPRYSSLFNRIITDTIKVTSLNSVVSVPAGEFICYKYETKDNSYDKDSLNNIIVYQNFLLVDYISDKGIVKEEFYFYNNGNPILFGSMVLRDLVHK